MTNPVSTPAVRRLVCHLVVVAFVLLSPNWAAAGGGPENVFVVVNSHSKASRTIANHFVRLRRVPAINVLYLPWSGNREQVELSRYRKDILQPALSAIRRRRLTGQIDYLVFSSDFPWRVRLASGLPKTKFDAKLNPVGSLTGVTYLWKFAEAGSANLVSFGNNFYAPLPSFRAKAQTSSQSRGFRSWYGWSPGGRVLEAGGPSYLLSTMLGVTSGRGNTVDEVVHYLNRSALADGTHPGGTIYFMRNGDIRSITRQAGFKTAIDELKRLGVRAELLDGKIPLGRDDVQGTMVGTPSFNWAASGSKILPGAICEHLTSWGGVLSKNSSQTPLTAFLKFGAAGASGTVIEPTAIQAKFPLPAVQVHYARGCSLAEAFYQAVSGPYQLLIVGDPLCRPWAVIPTVHVDSLRPGETVSGLRTITPSASVAKPHAIEHFELFIDGVREADCHVGGRFALDTNRWADGYHEVRIVAVESSPIRSQGRLIIPMTVDNHGQRFWFGSSPTGSVLLDDTINIEVSCAGAHEIRIYQNSRQLGRIRGASGQLSIKASQLGRGPVTLRAVAKGPRDVVARPIRLRVE